MFDSSKPDKKHTNPRTEINLHGKRWCHDCYERMLFETGQHSRIGWGAATNLYRDALYPQSIGRDRTARGANVNDVLDAVASALSVAP